MILVNLGFRWLEWFLGFGFWCLISLLLARLEKLLIWILVFIVVLGLIWLRVWLLRLYKAAFVV